jgi:hypothetical protein
VEGILSALKKIGGRAKFYPVENFTLGKSFCILKSLVNIFQELKTFPLFFTKCQVLKIS